MGRRYTPFDPFERSPFNVQDFTIPRPPRRFWIGVGFFGLAVLVILLANPLIYFWTEAQWYQALGLQSVYLARVQYQAWLFAGSLLVAFLVAAGNVLIALRARTGGPLRAVGIRRATLRSGVGLAGLGAAALIALILSAGVGRQWQDLVLFLHYSDSGVREPLSGLLGALLLFNLVRRRYAIPIAAGSIWAAAAILGAIYPGLVQNVAVRPSELNQERPYIQNEIKYTRQAYGLQDVQAQQFQGDAPLTAADVSN